MIRQWTNAFLALVLMLAAGSAMANGDAAAQRLDVAREVLQQFVSIPDNSLSSALLRHAYGIAVIPDVWKVGFLGAVRHGRGVISVRTAKGRWSKPAFISLTGGSFGFQAGVSSTDIILVFKTERSIDKLAGGQFTLGGDASVAAGPFGRSAGAATSLDLNAEVFSYARSRGLFAGVSVDGAHLGIDQDADAAFYRHPGISAREILRQNSDAQTRTSAQRFVRMLERYMPPASNTFDYSSVVHGDRSTAMGGTHQVGD